MTVLFLLLGCWGPTASTGPTPFESMVHEGRRMDTRSLGIRVRGEWPEGWRAPEREEGEPWIIATKVDTPRGPKVKGLDIVLPDPEQVALVHTYWLEPDAVDEVGVLGWNPWQKGRARVSTWHQANSTVVGLWEPVEPEAFEPRLVVRPYYPFRTFAVDLAECTPVGYAPGTEATPLPFATDVIDTAAELAVGETRVRWVSSGPEQRQRIVATLDKALGPAGEDGRWVCGTSGHYTVTTLDDGRVEVVLTTDPA